MLLDSERQLNGFPPECQDKASFWFLYSPAMNVWAEVFFFPFLLFLQLLFYTVTSTIFYHFPPSAAIFFVTTLNLLFIYVTGSISLINWWWLVGICTCFYLFCINLMYFILIQYYLYKGSVIQNARCRNINSSCRYENRHWTPFSPSPNMTNLMDRVKANLIKSLCTYAFIGHVTLWFILIKMNAAVITT